MLSGLDQNQINEWKSSLYEYEKNKRTRKPFGKKQSIYDVKIVHSSQVKQKERQFDPLLQKYNNQNLQKKAYKIEQAKQNLRLSNYLVIFNQQMKKNVKFNNEYDIVNLHPSSQQKVNPEKQYNQWSKQKNKNNPIRNLYNIINNQQVPHQYLKNRSVKLQDRESSRKIYQQKLRQSDYDFVKGRYLENNEQKFNQEKINQESRIKQKLNKSHLYDNVFQRYYNPELQETYQSELYKSQLAHGKKYQQKLPPSYRDREPLILNYSQEKTPSSLKKIIQKQQNSLRKNQLRYAVEEQYKKRNQEEYQKRQKILKNKVHEGKVFQDMAKEYNIINNKLHQLDKSLYYEKNVKGHPYSYDFLKNQNSSQNRMTSKNVIGKNKLNENWEVCSQGRSSRSNSSFDSRRFSIKSGGFA